MAAAPPPGPVSVTGLRVHQPLLAIPPERRVQVALTGAASPGASRIQVFGDNLAPLADAVVSPASEGPQAGPASAAAIEQRLAGDGVAGDDLYRLLAGRGLRYGPAYRHVLRASQAGEQVFALLAAPPDGAGGDDLAPRLALLDAVVHAADLAGEPGTVLACTGIEWLVMRAGLNVSCYAHAVLHPSAAGVRADVWLYDLAGDPLAQAAGVTLLRLALPEPDAPTARRATEDAPGESRAAWQIHGQARDSLLAAPAGDARRAAAEMLARECVAGVARIPVLEVHPDAPLRSLGIDSLMSLEVRNMLEASFGVSLPSKIILNNPTVREIVPLVADAAGIPLDGDLG